MTYIFDTRDLKLDLLMKDMKIIFIDVYADDDFKTFIEFFLCRVDYTFLE